MMHAVIRQYSGENASGLFDALEENKSDVEEVLRGVPGFVSYSLFRTPGGGVSATVCDDKSGTDESSRRAAERIKANISVAVPPPVISEGDTILHLS
jgi:hypothetical protein